MSISTPTDRAELERLRARSRPAPPNAIDKVRTRLAEGREPAQDFDYDLLHMFVRNEIGAVLTIPLLAIIIGLASMFWAPPHEALIWLGTLLICRFLLMRYIREFERDAEARHRHRRLAQDVDRRSRRSMASAGPASRWSASNRPSRPRTSSCSPR